MYVDFDIKQADNCIIMSQNKCVHDMSDVKLGPEKEKMMFWM